MLEGVGKIWIYPGRTYIYVPIQVAKDSAFPFKNGDYLRIRIDVERGCLIIERVEKGKK